MKFSFIVPHYDGSISDDLFIEGMESIAASTYKDYEVRVYHDGPLSRPLPDLDQFGFEYSFRETKKRYNDWGHSLRDLGIREAEGEYIIHFNPDNLLYPDALQGMIDAISRYEKHDIINLANRAEKTPNLFNNCVELIICPIVLLGVVRAPSGALFRTWDPENLLIMDGFPVRRHNIDCMQVVASKKAWLSIGGWHDKSETSDGPLAEQLVRKAGAVYSQKVIGVHR